MFRIHCRSRPGPSDKRARYSRQQSGRTLPLLPEEQPSVRQDESVIPDLPAFSASNTRPPSVFPHLFSITLISLWNRIASWSSGSLRRRRRPELIAETSESRRDLLEGLSRIPEGIDRSGRAEEEQSLAVAEVLAFKST